MNKRCPDCNNLMSFLPNDGLLKCSKCNNTINIDEADIPGYGSAAKAHFIKEKSKENIYADSDQDNTLQFTKPNHADTELAQETLSVSDASKAFRKWNGFSLFTENRFNKAVKSPANYTLMYVPAYFFHTQVSTRLEGISTTAVENDTHYYDIDHRITSTYMHNAAATDEMSEQTLKELFPFKTDKTVSFDEYNYSDSHVCKITKNPDVIYPEIQDSMLQSEKDRLMDSASDYQSVYNCNFESSFDSCTRTIYLPVWKLQFNKKGQNVSLFMNGHTGRITGPSQTSSFKLACFTAFVGLITFFALFFLGISGGKEAEAKVSFKADGFNPIICDNADLFDEYEEISILDSANTLKSKTGFIYVFITTENVKDYMVGKELENIYNDHENELLGEGTVLFLINTDRDNPFCLLQGYKSAAQLFTKPICAYITDMANAAAKAGDYDHTIDVLFEALNGVSDGSITDSTLPASYTDNGISDLQNDIPVYILLLCVSMAISSLITYIIYRRGRVLYFVNEKNDKKQKQAAKKLSDTQKIRTYRVYVRTISK